MNRTKQNKTSNPIEKDFMAAAYKNGWQLTRRGWPDYLCWKDGELICVEVKRDGQRLKQHQELVLRKLAEHGLRCYRWSPLNGFVRVLPGNKNAQINRGVRVYATARGEILDSLPPRDPVAGEREMESL